MNLSVCIIAFNEEKRLPKLLDSLPKDVEIILVDSLSTDNTVEIARSRGALVFQKTFENYSDQKNFALAKASHQWILSLDSDEVLYFDFEEIKSIINNSKEERGFTIKRYLYFMGKRLYFGKTTDYPLRLFKKNNKFIGLVHEKIDLPRHKTKSLKKSYIDHYSYENLSDYFNKFNKYTSMVALSKSKKTTSTGFIIHIFRPFVEFIVRYFFRLGLLDGYPGFTYAFVSSVYSFVKYAKIYERKI